MKKTALILSAHAADFVWRCGGAIALHSKIGYNVTVVCLSFGERGESAKLWKKAGMNLKKVKDTTQKSYDKNSKIGKLIKSLEQKINAPKKNRSKK